MTETVTRQLAEFAAGLRFEDLPDAVVMEARRLILDTVGCGFGGHAIEKGQMAVALAEQMGGVPEATILGRRAKVPAALAAFANGDLMNALDWNVLMPPSHVPPYAIPAALALAETTNTSGRDLITACVLAMEVSGRVGTSLGGLRATKGGYPLRVWGISSNQIGATAGAAHVLGLDATTMQHALGLAAYHAPLPSHVKYNHTKEAGYAKYAPAGWMSQAGVVTARLAEMGYRGDTSFLEGEHGFWAMNGAPEWMPEKITDGLGESLGLHERSLQVLAHLRLLPIAARRVHASDRRTRPPAGRDRRGGLTTSRNSPRSPSTGRPSQTTTPRQRRVGHTS